VDTINASEAIDRLISRRASQDRRPDPDEEDPLWKASVRAHNRRIREENRAAWHDYFCRLAACLRARAEECERRARDLCQDEGRPGA
jgi:hypothetical protein